MAVEPWEEDTKLLMTSLSEEHLSIANSSPSSSKEKGSSHALGPVDPPR